jgi:hypothetical protein
LQVEPLAMQQFLVISKRQKSWSVSCYSFGISTRP